jgi:hypothetical protein
MQLLVLTSLCIVVLILLYICLSSNSSASWLDRGPWHVPDHLLNQFNLDVFILCKDYLFIQNQAGDIIHDGPITCEVLGDELRISNCPSFL